MTNLIDNLLSESRALSEEIGRLREIADILTFAKAYGETGFEVERHSFEYFIECLINGEHHL